MNRRLFAVHLKKLRLIVPASRIKLTFPRIGRIVPAVASKNARSCKVSRAVKSTTQQSGATRRRVLRSHSRFGFVC